MKKYLFILTTIFLFTSCSLTGPGDDADYNSEFSNPDPPNHATSQPVVVTLKWSSSGFEKYDVYFSKITPPDIVVAKGITSTSFIKSGLSYNTHYFWKVRGYKSDGSWVESPIWDFTTRSLGGGSGEGISFIDLGGSTEIPSYVKILFSAVDNQGYPVSDISIDDLDVYEDGETISPSESSLFLKQYLENHYTMRVALVLDNSTSLTNDIDEIKNAANDFIDNVADTHYQIAIFKFSGTTETVQDFTSDKNLLHSAVNSLNVGEPTTDLYGAVITGCQSYSSEFSVNNIESGATVIFTDGKDTQGSHSLEEALNSTQDKRVYTVGLGNEIDPEVLRQIATSGFFYIDETNELINVFNQIKEDIERYSRSFYWLTYLSPKRGNNMHSLIIRSKDPNSSSYIEYVYSSSEFFTASPGLYINPTATQPEGITEISIAKNLSKIVIAYSFHYPNASYNWEITSGSELIDLDISGEGNNTTTILAGSTKGDAEISVTDNINNLNKTLTVHITD